MLRTGLLHQIHYRQGIKTVNRELIQTHAELHVQKLISTINTKSK